MERIYVAVRPRPLSPEESETSPWRISGNTISLSNHSSKFEFDRVFGEDCKTVDIFGSRTKEIVASVVRGFNGTVFAYGQTSSGKTYTMRGSANEPGIIPLSVHELFCSIQEKMDREFLLRMSYMEIYNEEINDLLAPEHRKLQIHESLEIVESRDRSVGDNSFNCFDAVRVSALNLVDLAGSERAGKTGAEGMRLKEGSHINKSLMALGTVIKKLSDGAESLGGHVPYRDSKLTRILQPALGGNANTTMICNITLSQVFLFT
ncbi:Kinesin-like protein NACK1 [Platanthera guangdongensis]|uniref:Kinesin-like protein NACK1 n=1 Tax=Platanthera guangdongensis TaxID=2320717 RepID=A0ABR2MPR6_9ASPA